MTDIKIGKVAILLFKKDLKGNPSSTAFDRAIKKAQSEKQQWESIKLRISELEDAKIQIIKTQGEEPLLLGFSSINNLVKLNDFEISLSKSILPESLVEEYTARCKEGTLTSGTILNTGDPKFDETSINQIRDNIENWSFLFKTERFSIDQASKLISS